MKSNFNQSLVFGVRLSQILKKRKIKQYQLAKAIDVSTQIISNYVTGRSFPSQKTINNICLALDIEKDWLLGVDINPQLLNVNIISSDVLDDIVLLIKEKLNEEHPFISDNYYNDFHSLFNLLFTLNGHGLAKIKNYIEDISLNNNNLVTDEADYEY